MRTTTGSSDGLVFEGNSSNWLGPTSTVTAPVNQLDFVTVLRAMQSLSSEIVTDKLIDALMRMVVALARAERGALILLRGEQRHVVAEASTRGETVIVTPREQAMPEIRLPESIMRFVGRTRETVVLDDASVHNRFSDEDAYLREQRLKSILCLPLLTQDALTGLLYLENNLASRVFTSRRVAVLELLASQAAISLDNARLYGELAELNLELTHENSERKRAEQALRTSEQRLQDIIDHTSAAIFVKDLELRYVLVNSEFERQFNVRRSEMRGKNDFDVLPHAVAKMVRANDARVIAAGTPVQFDEVVPWEEGNRFYMCAKFLLRDREGRPYAVCGTATDITERKNSEDALQQAQAELARINRATTMEQLAASIAHEVNQPLGAVIASGKACLNWLSANPPNVPEVRGAVESMLRDSNRAGNVLKRVRAILRKTPYEKSSFNVNQVIEEVLALRASELRKHRVELLTELNSRLPNVSADFVQLQQVLLNLVTNAIESMARTTDRLRVLNIKSCPIDRAERAGILVSVRDSGVGLAADEIERVFDAFHSTKPNGMGMGLWICRSIIEAHEGQLTTRTNEIGGATFEFFLPFEISHRDKGLRHPETTSKRIVGYEGPRMKILVVDDEELNRLFLRELLAPIGFNSVEADSAEEALCLVHDSFDAVISDLHMPGYDGHALCQNLRSLPQTENLIVIACSGNVFADEEELARVSGFSGFLPKPVLEEELFQILGEHLKLKWIYS